MKLHSLDHLDALSSLKLVFPSPQRLLPQSGYRSVDICMNELPGQLNFIYTYLAGG